MDGQTGDIRFGRVAVVAAAVVIATVTYAVGHALGKTTEPGSAARGPAPAPVDEPVTAVPAGIPAPADLATDSAAAVPGGEPAEAPPEAPAGRGGGPAPAALPAEPPPAAAQPITGPGRPPLPMQGGGPFGTRRTTGAEYVALTFDDGPDPRWTPEVLAELRKYGVKATFCVVGQMAAQFPELVREIVADGHTLCNHSWSHDVGLGNRSRADIREDLERTNAAIHRAAPGTRVSYYRQPGGAWTEAIVDIASDLGMSSLHWAVDPQDWSQPGAEHIADVLNTGTGAGAIVLLHDGGGERRGTVKALTRVLPGLAARHSLGALPPGIDAPNRHGLELPLKPSQR